MRILVISDTHDVIPDGLLERWVIADEIWHLGDVCAPHTLEGVKLLGKPMTVVAGNCDSWPGWPLSRRMERGGKTLHLEHIPRRRPAPNVDVMLHGHLHVPRDEVDPMGVRWLNPGCISEAHRGAPASFAWLTIPSDGSRFDWKIEWV
jgi:putative phosphoesterase